MIDNQIGRTSISLKLVLATIGALISLGLLWGMSSLALATEETITFEATEEKLEGSSTIPKDVTATVVTDREPEPGHDDLWSWKIIDDKSECMDLEVFPDGGETLSITLAQENSEKFLCAHYDAEGDDIFDTYEVPKHVAASESDEAGAQKPGSKEDIIVDNGLGDDPLLVLSVIFIGASVASIGVWNNIRKDL